MTVKSEHVFEFEGKKYKVRKPNNKIRRESDAVYAKAYRDALTNNYFLATEVDELLTQRGIVEKDEKQTRHAMLQRIRKMEFDLISKKYGTVDDGYKLAMDIKKLRADMLNIGSSRSELQANTVERQAENSRFNFFAYRCSSTEDGRPLWASYEEFIEDESDLAQKVSTEVLLLIYGIRDPGENKVERNYTENRWLIEHKFMDEKLRLIDKKGRLINDEGKLINEEGFFVDEKGNRIDSFGYYIDAEGRLLLEPEKAEVEDEVDDKEDKTDTESSSFKFKPENKDIKKTPTKV